MGLKISQIPLRNVITGNEILPIVDLDVGDNFTIALDTIKTIIHKGDVGLGNVDDVSDLNKPISQSVANALITKANLVHNHSIQDITGLSTTLATKADAVHTHLSSAISDFNAAVTNIVQSTTSPSDVAVGILEW